MSTANAILDRALEIHQSILEVRQTYEEAFARVLTHREQYEGALRDLEQAKRTLRKLEEENDDILRQLRIAMKGTDHEESQEPRKEATDQTPGGLSRQDGHEHYQTGQHREEEGRTPPSGKET